MNSSVAWQSLRKMILSQRSSARVWYCCRRKLGEQMQWEVSEDFLEELEHELRSAVSAPIGIFCSHPQQVFAMGQQDPYSHHVRDCRKTYKSFSQCCPEKCSLYLREVFMWFYRSWLNPSPQNSYWQSISNWLLNPETLCTQLQTKLQKNYSINTHSTAYSMLKSQILN